MLESELIPESIPNYPELTDEAKRNEMIMRTFMSSVFEGYRDISASVLALHSSPTVRNLREAMSRADHDLSDWATMNGRDYPMSDATKVFLNIILPEEALEGTKILLSPASEKVTKLRKIKRELITELGSGERRVENPELSANKIMVVLLDEARTAEGKTNLVAVRDYFEDRGRGSVAAPKEGEAEVAKTLEKGLVSIVKDLLFFPVTFSQDPKEQDSAFKVLAKIFRNKPSASLSIADAERAMIKNKNRDEGGDNSSSPKRSRIW